MDLDLTSFAYGFSIATSNGNPNWATSLGQGVGYKINASASINEILKGMIYTSVAMEEVQTRIGKGGRLYKGTDASSGIVLGSRFEKVYANGALVPSCSLILILTKDNSKSHTGRLRLKYSPHNSLVNANGDVVVSNDQEVAKIREALGLSSDACWFVYAMDVLEQDKLYLSIGIADPEKPVVYETNAALHEAWREIIQAAGGAIVPRKEEESAEIPLSAPPPSPESSLLPLALRLFAERRVGEWREAGREVNAKVRDYFAALTAEKLDAFGDDQITELFCGVKDADGKVVFSPMWSGTPGSGWGNIKPSSSAETKAVRDFLVRLRSGVGAAAEFRQDGFDHPKGFGPAVVSELLMKFHPKTCFKHGQTTFEVLTELGLVKFDHPFKNDFSDADYKQVCGVAAKLLAAMCEMKLPRSIAADGTGDGEAPDYLTVNEFVWFVNENKELIKEESMKMKLEMPDTSRKNPGTRTWADVLSGEPDELMNRLVAALLTKPFAILAGASGTGKSRMVRKLAYMTCLNAQIQPDRKTKKPIENFCMVAVKPNWHDSTDLLGYRSAVSSAHRYVSTDFVRFVLKAHAFPDTPFFVCLDEMNLAPVEHYFAEFLSASETMREEADGEFVTDPIVGPGEFDGDLANLDPSGYAVPSERKALIERIGLYLPKNLFVVGTVNMDDSTSAFSRKVVDRAMTLVMDDVNYADLQKTSKFDLFDQVGKEGKLEAEGVLLAEEQIAAFVNRRGFRPESLQSPLVERLTALKEILHQTPLAIGYRFARECVQYRDAVRMLMAEKDGVDYDGFALDHLILMKVLPRLVGNRDDHADLLNKLKDFFKGLNEQKLGDHEHALSASALKRMEQAAEHNGGYLSFYP